VKVQYEDIYDMFRGDIKTISFITHALAFFFPQFTFTWVLPEFHSALTMELDFRNEANNAEKTRQFFKYDEGVKIPDVYLVRLRCKI